MMRRRGQMVVVAALFLPVILLVAGLSVDGLFLYRDHARLDSWVYEAASAGSSEAYSIGDRIVLDEPMAIGTASKVLESHGLTPSSGCASDVHVDDALFLDVSVRCQRPTFLMGAVTWLLNGSRDLASITISAEARVQATVLY